MRETLKDKGRLGHILEAIARVEKVVQEDLPLLKEQVQSYYEEFE